MLFLGSQALCSLEVSAGREELADLVNWGHLLSPVVNALGLRSPIMGAEDSYVPSSRLAALASFSEDDIGDGRWQMIDTPYSGLDEWVFHSLYQPHWLQRDHEGWLDPAEGLFGARLETRDLIEVWEDYQDHLDTFWTSAHLLPRKAMVRLSQWEQCGLDRSLGIAALLIGLGEQREEVLSFFETSFSEAPEKRRFGLRATDILRLALEHRKDIWAPMVEFNRQVLRHGISAQEPCTGFWEGLLGFAERGLYRRGLGEEQLLRPLQNVWKEPEPTDLLRRTHILHGDEAFLGKLWLNRGGV